MDTGSEATSTSDANAGASEFDSAKSLRGLSSFNASLFNWGYQIPASRLLGKSRDQGAGKVLDYAIGGWTLSGTYTASSGQPFTVFSGYDYNADGIGFDRPILLDNSLLGASVDNGRINPSTGTTYSVQQLPSTAFVPNAVTPTAARPFAPGTAGEGSIGRNTFFMQRMNNFDIGVHKSFRIREGHSLTFRTEIFNLMNRVQFSPPTSSTTNTSFGRISSSRNPANFVGPGRLTGARFLQMALRYVW